MKKKSIFDEIFKHNSDTFYQFLFPEKVRKRIYDRCYKRCKRKKLSDEEFKNCLYGEIFEEMHKVQLGIDPAQKYQRGIKPSPSETIDTLVEERIGNLDFWGEQPDRAKEMKDLERAFNKAVEREFAERFCSRCKSSICHCGEEDGEK